jgi:hypothetical protein
MPNNGLPLIVALGWLVFFGGWFAGRDVFLTPFSNRVAKKVLDLAVDAAQLVLGPLGEGLDQIRRKPQQKWFAIGHRRFAADSFNARSRASCMVGGE